MLFIVITSLFDATKYENRRFLQFKSFLRYLPFFQPKMQDFISQLANQRVRQVAQMGSAAKRARTAVTAVAPR